MIEFKILKKSKKSQARLGQIKTSFGIVQTPTLVPVATQAAVKALTNRELEQTKSQILIANTFHLHLRPGEKTVEKLGGLHGFMNWKNPIMTDSGGFQAFSLGFGKDFGMGKILKQKSDIKIREGQQPKLLKITDEGVLFRSYIDGKEIYLGPKESIKIQEKLGADIIFAFDECTSPAADCEYTEKSMQRTHRWAKISLASKKTDQALFGIIQGGKYKNLRKMSAEFIGKLDFNGFGVGGEFGDDKTIMTKTLSLVFGKLPPEKPRHLLGIGYLEDIEKIVKTGVDTFDCIVPTHYARRGIAFTSAGKIDLTKSHLLQDKNPLDKKCDCFVCQDHTKGYLCHLFRSREISGMSLLTFHNLYFFNSYLEKIRENIKRGEI